MAAKSKPSTGRGGRAIEPPAGGDPRLLAMRVEHFLPPRFATNKPMFGGITFLHRGNMLCCASRKGLMVRVGAQAEPIALQSKFAAPCLGAGRPMAGFVIVEHAGLTTDDEIARWLQMARDYVEGLPEKVSRATKRTANSKP